MRGEFTGHGGYRPGAGRPRVTVRAKCRPGDLITMERWAQMYGVDIGQVAGKIIADWFSNPKNYLDAQDFRK